MAPQQVIVITGANKGLGLEHVNQFLEKTNHRLIATARAPEKAADLQKLASSHEGRLHIVQLETTDDESIKAFVKEVKRLAPEGIDFLVNNAGQGEYTSRAIETTGKGYRQVLNTNVVGPFLLSVALLPSLRKRETRTIVQISSVLGSTSFARKPHSESPLNHWGTAYWSSKAALNMQVAILSNDLLEEKFTVVALHPGWVQTDMGNEAARIGLGEGKKAPMDAPTSISLQQAVIANLTAKDSGRFLGPDGKDIDY